MSGSVAGAEMTTFFAPASMCFCAASRVVKNPVDSRTTSTPRSDQGSAPGSRSASTFSSDPAALITPSPSSTSLPSGPSTESYFRRCAIVAASPRSLIATMSNPASRSRCARKKFLPIRPKPLIPTFVFAMPRRFLPRFPVPGLTLPRRSARRFSRKHGLRRRRLPIEKHLETRDRRASYSGRRVRARPATDSDPVRRHGPERGSTGVGVVLGASLPARPSTVARGERGKLLQPPEAAVDRRFRRRRVAAMRELAQRQRRVTQPELCHLVQTLGQPLELAGLLQQLDGAKLRMRGSTRTDEVRVVGVGEAVRARARRRDDRVLLEREHDTARTGERKDVGD